MSRYAAVVLAAGLGTRFRAGSATAPSKLLATLEGTPLVLRVVEAALASAADPVIVVTGHARADVEAALAGRCIVTVHNPDYASGLASSVRAGVAAVPAGAAGAVVLLADMPMVTATLVDRLVAEGAAMPGAYAVVPVVKGRRGNPVLLSRTLFPAVAQLSGDAGARQLLRDPHLTIREIALDGDAAVFDVDEAADLERLRQRGSMTQSDGRTLTNPGPTSRNPRDPWQA